MSWLGPTRKRVDWTSDTKTLRTRRYNRLNPFLLTVDRLTKQTSRLVVQANLNVG
jgi:hypothetical protein